VKKGQQEPTANYNLLWAFFLLNRNNGTIVETLSYLWLTWLPVLDRGIQLGYPDWYLAARMMMTIVPFLLLLGSTTFTSAALRGHDTIIESSKDIHYYPDQVLPQDSPGWAAFWSKWYNITKPGDTTVVSNEGKSVKVVLSRKNDATTIGSKDVSYCIFLARVLMLMLMMMMMRHTMSTVDIDV